MNQLHIHPSLLGSTIRSVIGEESNGVAGEVRIILAAWLEEASETRFRPIFVVLALGEGGDCLKVNFPNEDWILTMTGP